jgi:hypothetical protein
MNVLGIIFAAIIVVVVLVALVALVISIPDIKRYLRIRQM